MGKKLLNGAEMKAENAWLFNIRFMLARRYRLPAYIHFPRGNAIVTADYILKVTPNDLPHSRFGFIVRKALEKRATKRNRVRRLLRSCVEELQNHIQPGYDMLFLLKQGIMEKERIQMYEEVQLIFKRHQLFTHPLV